MKEVVRYGSLQGRRGRLPSKAKHSVQSDQEIPPTMSILSVIQKAFEARPLHNQMSRPQKTPNLECVNQVLEYEMSSLFMFVNNIPNITEFNELDIRRLAQRNFFPYLATKYAVKYAQK